MSAIRSILLLTLVIDSIGFGKPAPMEVKTTTGFFAKFVSSDYLYLNLKGLSGEAFEYYCNIPKCAEWEMKESEFRNKKVILKWRESEFFIKELGQKKRIHEVVDFELAK